MKLSPVILMCASDFKDKFLAVVGVSDRSISYWVDVHTFVAESLTLADPRCLVPTPGTGGRGGRLSEPPTYLKNGSKYEF